MMNDIEKLESEKEVLNLLFGLRNTKITDSNVELISTKIYEKMLEHPTANAWSFFRFAIAKENILLGNLINVNERNLESVILRKHREDARKTRKALLGYCEMEPLYTPDDKKVVSNE